MKRSYVLAIFLFVALYIYLQFASNEMIGTVYSFKNYGFQAAFQLLEKLGVDAIIWKKSFKDLGGTDQTLVLSYGEGYAHIDKLESWVESGNTLVIFGLEKDYSKLSLRLKLPKRKKIDLYETIIIAAERDSKYEESETTLKCPKEIEDLCYNINTVSSFDTFFKIKKEKLFNFIFNQNNKPVIAYRSIGKGEIFYFADSKLAFNKFIDQHDNASFLYQVLTRKSKVMFDEFHHGYHDSVSDTMESRQDAVILFSIVFIIVLSLVTISRSKRFGQILASKNNNDARQTDFVAALGLLYKEHKVVDALSYYVQCWKSRVAKRYSISIYSDNETFVDNLLVSGVILEGNKKLFVSALNELSKPNSTSENSQFEKNIKILETIV